MEVFENAVMKQDEFGTKVDSHSMLTLQDVFAPTDDSPVHAFQSPFEYDSLLNDNPHSPNSKDSISNLSPSRTYTHPKLNVPRSLQTVQPDNQPAPQDPPLLPAFLITGLLIATIVVIIIWRHFTEQRRLALLGEDGDVGDIWGGGDAAEGVLEKPQMWDVFVSMVSEESGKKADGGVDSSLREGWKGWESVMPLSAKPFFVPTKNLQPRYLVPSDRPTTFMTRMFGGALEGYRLRYSGTSGIGTGVGGPIGNPLMSTIAPTNRLGGMRMRPDADVNDTRGWGGYDPEVEPYTDTFSKRAASQEDQIEKVQLSFIIAMPSEHHSRSKVEDRKVVRVRRTSEGGSSKTENDGGGELQWVEEERKEEVPASVPSPIEEEGELPELCLGSLMIPYG